MPTIKNDAFKIYAFKNNNSRHYQKADGRFAELFDPPSSDKAWIKFGFEVGPFKSETYTVELSDMFMVSEEEFQSAMFELFSANRDDVDLNFLKNLI